MRLSPPFSTCRFQGGSTVASEQSRSSRPVARLLSGQVDAVDERAVLVLVGIAHLRPEHVNAFSGTATPGAERRHPVVLTFQDGEIDLDDVSAVRAGRDRRLGRRAAVDVVELRVVPGREVAVARTALRAPDLD